MYIISTQPPHHDQHDIHSEYRTDSGHTVPLIDLIDEQKRIHSVLRVCTICTVQSIPFPYSPFPGPRSRSIHLADQALNKIGSSQALPLSSTWKPSHPHSKTDQIRYVLPFSTLYSVQYIVLYTALSFKSPK